MTSLKRRFDEWNCQEANRRPIRIWGGKIISRTVESWVTTLWRHTVLMNWSYWTPGITRRSAAGRMWLWILHSGLIRFTSDWGNPKVWLMQRGWNATSCVWMSVWLKSLHFACWNQPICILMFFVLFKTIHWIYSRVAAKWIHL